MITDILLLFFSLALILVSAEIFTNGVEALGKRLALTQAVVGSILAAIGTAMPETILPFIAILVYGGDSGAHIGVGAILGAPFMLSTLAFFLVGVTILVGFLLKKRKFVMNAEIKSMKRDLRFFILMYTVAILASMLSGGGRIAVALALVTGYFAYVVMTIRGESGSILHVEELYFSKWARNMNARGKKDDKKTHDGVIFIYIQILFALGVMVGGAQLFVGELEKLSLAWGIDPLIFALLVAPVATELPEKFNSVSWTIKGKDTLAAGNITGAMVFQSTFPVSLGLLFTDWDITGLALFSAILAILSALIILTEITFRKKISPVTLMSAGLLYIIYMTVIILNP
jgi:cation:H+ antiporter